MVIAEKTRILDREYLDLATFYDSEARFLPRDFLT